MDSDQAGRADIDRRLLAAHARHDGPALARLYRQAARHAASAGDTDAACFYRTQAYVWALETGDGGAADDREFLRTHGREH